MQGWSLAFSYDIAASYAEQPAPTTYDQRGVQKILNYFQ
jgi:hypothetical protein